MTEAIYMGKECRFAVHIPGDNPRDKDFHLIKEVVHYSDGRKVPEVRLTDEVKRSFWVTKPALRNHKSKKEWEYKKNLVEFRCTQTALVYSAASALGVRPPANNSLRTLSDSPYLYGSDILSTCIIKDSYRVKWPNLNSPYSVCMLDTETDVVDGTEEIILVSLCTKTEIYCVVTENFIRNVTGFKEKIEAAINKYIKDYVVKRKLKVTVDVAATEIDAIYKSFELLHKWKPDLLAIWNMNFDIPKIIDACNRAGISPADLFSDPAIPPHLRYFKYKQGISKKKKANGDVMSISPANQWHTVFSTSSFYVIDAMCVYRLVRLAKPEEQSYSLNAILDKELGIRKLTFEGASKYSGLRWHQKMQKDFKVEYCVYNIFDTLSMLELEDKTTDLSVSLPVFAGISDFSKFNSQPRRVVDELHFRALKKDMVMGSTGSSMVEELDSKTLPLTGWIVTLPAHQLVENGIRCIVEDNTLVTRSRLYVADIDVGGAYPTNQCVFNVSKETTKREVINVVGISKDVFTMQNINMLSGEVNSVDYCVTMFNFPKLTDLERLF